MQLLSDGRLLISEFDTGRMFLGGFHDDTVVVDWIIDAPVSIIDSVVSDLQQSTIVTADLQLLSIDEARTLGFPGVTTDGISAMFHPRYRSCAVRGGDTLDVTVHVMIPSLGKYSKKRIWKVTTAVVQLSLATQSVIGVTALLSSGENHPASVSILTTPDGWWSICSNFTEDVVDDKPVAKPYFSRHLFDGNMTTGIVYMPSFISVYAGAFNIPSKLGVGSFVWTDSRHATLFVSDIVSGETDSISFHHLAVDSLGGHMDSLKVGSPIVVDSTTMLILVSGLSTEMRVRTARWISIELPQRDQRIITGLCYAEHAAAYDTYFVTATASGMILSALRRDENGDWFIRQQSVQRYSW